MTYRKYKFRKYDPIFPILFEKERKKLTKILGEEIKIEHVGSTSVPGLGGKGIIDISILTPKTKLKSYMKKLKKLGFNEVPNHPGDDRRIFMQKVKFEGKKESRVHIHLCLTKEFWDSFIIFRDYLKKNKKAMEDYANIKKEAAKHAKNDGKKYGAHKMDLLKKLVKKALKDIR